MLHSGIVQLLYRCTMKNKNTEQDNDSRNTGSVDGTIQCTI